MAKEVKQTRFLVRRATEEVWIWAEELAKRKDLEEVYAPNAKLALSTPTLPDVKKVTIEQIDAMDKAALLTFAQVRLNKRLDSKLEKDELADQIKQMITLAPDESPPDNSARSA